MMVIFADRRSRDEKASAKMSFVSPLCRSLDSARQSGDTKFSFGAGILIELWRRGGPKLNIMSPNNSGGDMMVIFDLT